jgi:diaminopimelate epimerase
MSAGRAEAKLPRRPAAAGPRFFKGHGLGNDYIVLRAGRLGFRLNPRAIRLICDRHLGIGSDGILLHEGARGADARMRIFNPDGSEAQKSGNGARIFARYLSRWGLPGRSVYAIETAGGRIRAQVLAGGTRGGTRFRVDMGSATFDSAALPMRGRRREAVRERIGVGGRTLVFTGVSVGNPHAVFFLPRLDPVALRRLGPLIERHSLFPERTNVQFAHAKTRSRVEAIIWERGAGETQASGSSACAVASAGRRLGLLGDRVTVVMPGGTLAIEINASWRIWMTGPAVEVATGVIGRDLLARLRRR